LHESYVAGRGRNQRSLSLAHRDNSKADEGGGIRVGNGLLHQSDAAGRVGAVFAGSEGPRNSREKLGIFARSNESGRPGGLPSFVIMTALARYPSGPRRSEEHTSELQSR